MLKIISIHAKQQLSHGLILMYSDMLLSEPFVVHTTFPAAIIRPDANPANHIRRAVRSHRNPPEIGGLAPKLYKYSIVAIAWFSSVGSAPIRL